MKRSKKTQIKLNYGRDVAVLPSKAADFVDRAKKFDIKVLFCLSSSESFRGKNGASEIAKALNCSEAEVESSLAFWNGAGIVDILDEGAEIIAPQAEKANEKEEKTVLPPKRTKISELPQYTTEELNKLLEVHEGVCELIDECQQILGKIFNTAEVKIIMGLVDYFSLENEYIIVLMHYCASLEKRSVRYLEKIAVSCVDEGITDAKILSATLKEREAKKELENKIRAMFGIGGRSLTKKEKGFIGAWREEYCFDIDIINKAYEITVNATGNASIPYANAILEKWYSEGLKDIDAIEAYLDGYKKEKGESGESFELDEFFNAAINRSYGEKKKES